MPLSTSFAGLSARALGWASSAITKIYDSFSRVTSGSLGTATTGQIWTALTGVWSSNSGVAQTSTSPSSYPNAGFPTVGVNASASVVSPSPGAGIMVWETGAGDWWGSATYVTETSSSTYGCISNSCCSGSNTCTAASCCSCNYCTYSYGGGYYPSPSVSCFCTNPNSSGGGCVANSCCTGSNTCVSNTCCSTYVTSTTYVWNSFVAIIKSVASAITTIATSSNLGTQSNTTGTYPGPVVNSLAVTTLGSTITANAYSDTGFATLLVTLSATNSSPSGTGVGILLTPSSGVQGTTVGPFSAT